MLFLQVRGKQAANQAKNNLKRSGKQIAKGGSTGAVQCAPQKQASYMLLASANPSGLYGSAIARRQQQTVNVPWYTPVTMHCAQALTSRQQQTWSCKQTACRLLLFPRHNLSPC
jgi:hypothetical protein